MPCWKQLKITSFALFIAVGALLFGFLMSYLKLPRSLAEFAIHLNLSPMILLLTVMLLLFFLGCLLDTVSIVLIVVPIILPMLLANGMDPIWLGLIICQNMEIALSTPPVGMNLFVVAGIARPFGITYADIVKGNMPYIVSDLVFITDGYPFSQYALWLQAKCFCRTDDSEASVKKIWQNLR